MRMYSTLLVLEDILNYIPNTNPDIQTLAQNVVYPSVSVVEADCGTATGELDQISYMLEGETELATGNVLSHDRITQILSQGVYTIAIRNTSHCISSGGVCQACYSATFPDRKLPSVGDAVTIYPEYIIRSEVFSGVSGQTVFMPFNDPTVFSKIRLYIDGVLQSSSAYSYDSSSITLHSPIPAGSSPNIAVKYISEFKSPYMAHLSNTYSGALLGLKAYSGRPLPIRRLLLTSLLPSTMIESLAETLKSSSRIPKDSSDYLDKIPDPLEKALFMLTLYSVYNAQ